MLSSPLADLTARAGGAVRVRSADPQRLTTALRDQALQVTTGTDHALLVRGASSERIGQIAFAAGVPVHELVNDAGLLEDAFLLSPGAGAITLIAWAGVLGILGIALSVRQDIN